MWEILYSDCSQSEFSSSPGLSLCRKAFSVFVSYDIERFTLNTFKFFYCFKQVVAVVNSVVIYKGFYCSFQLGVLMFSDFIFNSLIDLLALLLNLSIYWIT